jgi:hypothetical protein
MKLLIVPAEVRETSLTGGQKGVKLSRHDLIPVKSLQLLAEHFGKGAKKYDAHNWRRGYEWSKSYNAMRRHMDAFWAGYELDVCSNEPDACLHEHSEKGLWAGEPDTCWNHTGSHHIVAVMWHATVLLEIIERYPDYDDRYIPNKPKH